MMDALALVGVLAVLFLVLVASYFSTKLVGKYFGNSSYGTNGGEFSVVRRLALGRDQHLMVVKLGGRHLLLGCTPTNVNLVTELSEEESQSFVRSQTPSQTGNFPSFAQWMAAQRGEKKDE